MQIQIPWRLPLVAGLFFAFGWFGRGKEVVEIPKVVTKTEVQTQDRIVDHVVTKVVQQVVRQPNGTVTKTTTETKTAATVETKKVDKSQVRQSVVPVVPALADWSVGVNWTPRLDPDAYMPTGVEVGHRIIGDVWGTAGFDWHTHSATIGVRGEF